MIATKINEEFPEHEIKEFSQSIYIVDYTHQTKNDPVKRSVEIHVVKPTDIDSFFLLNSCVLNIGAVIYDKYSFVDESGMSQTQCECVAFPAQSEESSWIMFLELKYCEYRNAVKNLNKAKCQVRATYEYYKQKGIIKNRQLAYLLVSLPKQTNTPFESFISTQEELVQWRNKNIIFRGVNSAKIKDQYLLDV